MGEKEISVGDGWGYILGSQAVGVVRVVVPYPHNCRLNVGIQRFAVLNQGAGEHQGRYSLSESLIDLQ